MNLPAPAAAPAVHPRQELESAIKCAMTTLQSFAEDLAQYRDEYWTDEHKDYFALGILELKDAVCDRLAKAFEATAPALSTETFAELDAAVSAGVTVLSKHGEADIVCRLTNASNRAHVEFYGGRAAGQGRRGS